MNRVPRSAYDRTGGHVYFARMLDKIRLHAAGRLREDFRRNLGMGFDAGCCCLLGTVYAALCERVLGGGPDDEVLAWCPIHPTDEQIFVWNKFMEKRGWRDEDDGSTQELESYKAASGLAHRTDVVTFFDYYEVDEGRRPWNALLQNFLPPCTQRTQDGVAPSLRMFSPTKRSLGS